VVFVSVPPEVSTQFDKAATSLTPRDKTTGMRAVVGHQRISTVSPATKTASARPEKLTRNVRVVENVWRNHAIFT